MVGGLVEQQHLGVSDKQLRQRDAHLPTTGELAGQARHIGFSEAETEQDPANLRLDGVAAEHLERIARTPCGGKLRLRGALAKLRLELVQASLRLEHLHLGAHDLLEDGAFTHLDSLLLEIAHARALREQNAPLVGIRLARDDVEKRGLARAVRGRPAQGGRTLRDET